MDNEIRDHQKRIFAQLSYCEHQYLTTKDEKWMDRGIALNAVLATIDQTLVLEYGLHRLFDVLKTDLINDTVKQLVGDDEPTTTGDQS
jgi:hypothetical protein